MKEVDELESKVSEKIDTSEKSLSPFFQRILARLQMVGGGGACVLPFFANESLMKALDEAPINPVLKEFSYYVSMGVPVILGGVSVVDGLIRKHKFQKESELIFKVKDPKTGRVRIMTESELLNLKKEGLTADIEG